MQQPPAAPHGKRIASWLRALRNSNVRLAPEVLKILLQGADEEWLWAWHGTRQQRVFDIIERSTGRRLTCCSSTSDPRSIVRLRGSITDFVTHEE